MPLGPGLHPFGGAATLAQQELAEAMPRPELVLLRRLAGPYEVPQRFVGRVGDPHGGEIPCPVTAGELLRVAPVGLHPVTRLHRDEGGGDDVTVDAEPGELPVEDVPAGAGFVTHPEVLAGAELADQLGDGLEAIGQDPQGADLPIRFRHGDGDGLGVDIQTDIAQVDRHRPAPSRVALRGLGELTPRNLRSAMRAGHSIVTTHRVRRSAGLRGRPVSSMPVLAAFGRDLCLRRFASLPPAFSFRPPAVAAPPSRSCARQTACSPSSSASAFLPRVPPAPTSSTRAAGRSVPSNQAPRYTSARRRSSPTRSTSSLPR